MGSAKAFDSVDHNELWKIFIFIFFGKFLKRWECQTILPVSRETCIRISQEAMIRTLHGTMDWLQIGKEVR